MHRTWFIIQLNYLVANGDHNHCGSVMLRKWNDGHSCRPLICKGMDGKFMFQYFAGYTVHLIPVEKR
jgi:hypothetical protein